MTVIKLKMIALLNGIGHWDEICDVIRRGQYKIFSLNRALNDRSQSPETLIYYGGKDCDCCKLESELYPDSKNCTSCFIDEFDISCDRKDATWRQFKDIINGADDSSSLPLSKAEAVRDNLINVYNKAVDKYGDLVKGIN